MKRLTCLTMILWLVLWGGVSVSDAFSQEEIGIPTLAGAKELYKRTLKDLELLGNAVSDYVMDNQKAPVAATISELLEMDSGNGLSFADFYMDEIPPEKVPSKDPWGNDFLYHAEGERFQIASAGSDGEFKGFGQTGVYLFTSQDIEGKDIIFANQGFVFRPMEQKQVDILFGLTFHFLMMLFGLG
ncbi:MAG: hypothetical protein GY940_20925 [bacterium]|nr:hypothetical protein [bacterium]